VSTPFQYLKNEEDIHGWARNLVRRLNAESAGAGVPVGLISQHGGASLPVGWLACDGATVSKALYPELFTVLGYTHGGSGDDFVLPTIGGGLFIIKA